MKKGRSFRGFAQICEHLLAGGFVANPIGVAALWSFSPAKSLESMHCTASERHGVAYLREILVAR